LRAHRYVTAVLLGDAMCVERAQLGLKEVRACQVSVNTFSIANETKTEQRVGVLAVARGSSGMKGRAYVEVTDLEELR
jgi:hypothetical protein